MKCRDCKFWTPEDKRWQGTKWDGVGRCLKIEMPDYYCKPESGASSLAYVRDGSDYFAALYCMPDFGCIEFQPRDA